MKCNDCHELYIGQSGRSIDVRMNEHKRGILDNKK